MKDIPAIVQSHMAKRIALYGKEPEQPLVEELFKRYSELQSTNDQAFLDAFQKLYDGAAVCGIYPAGKSGGLRSLFGDGTDGIHYWASSTVCRSASGWQRT